MGNDLMRDQRRLLYEMADVSASRHRAQLGDCATVGQKLISDTDSFWIDGYFEETSLGRIRDGGPATVKLIDYSQLVRGHVGGVARGIKIPKRAAGLRRPRLGKSDLHLGTPCVGRAGAHSWSNF
jgi:hypothetical protein